MREPWIQTSKDLSEEREIVRLQKKLAAKTAECERLREDAERWDWWRAKYPIHLLRILKFNYESMDDKTIDEATNAARKETP